MKDKGGRENRWNKTQYRRGFGLGWVRYTDRERERGHVDVRFTFLPSECLCQIRRRSAYLRPKLECLGSSSSYQPLIVEAKARTRREDRAARHSRLRKKVEGTPERPRLCVFRSNKHLYVQVIDDTKMHTLASTMRKPISEEFQHSPGPTIDVVKKVGEVIAKSCLDKGITKVAFDRGGYLYGRIDLDAAREHGLEF
ncbi:hypothetical protein LOK49_LG02G00195 [Camellia lanceoleosa]|uniref:Uncharacterized protein n=1 Tax=Camellia lanceoleosa TaxID=1840588 RepID=A0ACC0IJB0_9ERIC|nr:hypothetical protein LOK49_LG02G00195 [Camellia lanceoleosa]